MAQRAQSLLVDRVLQLPLVVDVGQKVRMLQVILASFIASFSLLAVILCRHDVALHPISPSVSFDRSDRSLAKKVESTAFLELCDTVVLTAECDETADFDTRASLDEAAQELASLAESESVDPGVVGAEVGVRCKVCADLIDLRGQVAEEGRPCVGAAFVSDTDWVDIGAWVHLLCELADRGDTVCVETITKTVPDDEWKRRCG